MIEENATVVRIDGKDTWVETQRKTACGQCSVSKGCGTSVLAKVVGKKAATMRVINEINAEVGDDVIIGLDEAALVKGALITYLFPLLMMIMAALFGQFVSANLGMEDSEVLVMLFAAGGFALGMFMLKRYSRYIQYKKQYQPVILQKL